jgi:hypothetical protein
VVPVAVLPASPTDLGLAVYLVALPPMVVAAATPVCVVGGSCEPVKNGALNNTSALGSPNASNHINTTLSRGSTYDKRV